MNVINTILRSIISVWIFHICICHCHKTFQISFQTKYTGQSPPSLDEWIELDINSIDAIHEFTACNWVLQRYFNKRISLNLWSYCTIESRDSELECVTAYLESSSASSHRDVDFHFDVRFNKTIVHTSAAIESFSHRKWVHLCSSFSTITGEQTSYYNGEVVGHTKTHFNDSSIIFK